MQNKKIRRVLLSVVILLMSLMVLVITTYVLFKDDIILVNHISAGDLNVSLIRTDLKGKILGTDGKLHDFHNPGQIDFSKPTEKNLFDLENDVYIVPGVEFKATLLVVNSGSTNFGYYVNIVIGDDSSIELCEQLYVTISAGDKKVSGTLADLYLGGEHDFVSVIESNGSSSFDIEIIFIDNGNSNAAMDKTVYFDVIVNAVQVAGNPETNND